jgi:heptosyltransferase-3
MTVVATGSNDPRERAYLDAVWDGADTPVARLDGQLDWCALATLLKGAALYVGTDTAVTHLAAATGCPAVALFGPTDPRLWGPWPAGGLDEPWNAVGSIQRRGNVWLVQHALPCVPCQKEGCERHLDSHAACLDRLSVAEVLLAADQALDEAVPAVRYAARRA